MVGPAFFLVAFQASPNHSPGMELTIVQADVIPSDRAVLVTGKAGYSLTRGMAVRQTTGNTYVPSSNGGTAEQALAVGMAMTTSDPDQPVVVCLADPELNLGATTLPATLVGQVISVGYTLGALVTHDELVESGLMVKVFGLCIAEGKLQMNLQGLVPAIEAAPAP